jgi:regulator of sigma E protease
VEDIIAKINGKELHTDAELIDAIDASRGKKVNLSIVRGGKEVDIQTEVKDIPAKEGALGVSISSTEVKFLQPPIWQRPFYGIYYGFGDAIFWGKAVLTGFRDMILQSLSGHVPKDIAGPIGIYQVTNQVAALGILPLINFMGVLSVNLAIINILPIPALDGGRLLFIIFEAVTRKRVTPKIEATIHSIGMIALLGLLVVITFFDIKRLADAGNLPPFLLQFFK